MNIENSKQSIFIASFILSPFMFLDILLHKYICISFTIIRISFSHFQNEPQIKI